MVEYLWTRLALLTAGVREREEGQTLVEYALIIFLIAIAAIVALKFLSTGVNNLFSKVANDL
jgi:Flp pilus assembly pilin Flp